MILHRRGFGPVGFVLLIIFLIPMWIFVFAPMFILAGQEATASGATGLDAFLWSNLNLWFFLILLVVIIIYYNLGGGNQ